MPDQLTGRALDAAIAELLGWTEVREQEMWHTTTFGERISDNHWVGCPPECVAGSMMHIPHYSTDPRAAFELEKAMRGWYLKLERTGTGYWAVFNRSGLEAQEPQHTDTPCLAIALAAHAALGGR